MRRTWLQTTLATATALILTVIPSGAALAGPPAAAPRHFVRQAGPALRLDGREFRYQGANNYYLFYESTKMVDDVLSRTAAAGFPVLRTWGWSDIGALDGSLSVGNKPNGVYFQYWNGSAPAYNDGSDGLAHLDYEVWKAGQDGVRLVIPFTNNWSDFGGMDQYVKWAGLTHHDDFYTSPGIQGWYQAYIAHLLNHVNPLTGIAYKDDPTIMAWELANEPRCVGSGLYPASSSCTTTTLTSWAGTMSAFVKKIDRNHLLGVGDEGFFCTDPASADYTVDCKSGVDTVALAALPHIDYMSYHLYPDGWSKPVAWGTQWITDHNHAAATIGKPAILGEFGSSNKASRNVVYQRWTDAFASSGGSGIQYWMLAGSQDDGTLYPDYDGFTVYCPSPVCTTLSNNEKRMASGQQYFPPVADNVAVSTAYATPVTFDPTSDAVAYQGAIDPAGLDLDPATPGPQNAFTTSAGTFSADPSGQVTFTPAAGYHGTAVATFTVSDQTGTASNAATMTVTVKPDQTAPIVFASFESAALDGWGSASWQTGAGTVSQESTFATDGTHGLHIATAAGGWFGTTLTTPVDLSGKSALKVDLQVGAAAGTSVDIAVQDGSTWCQGDFSWEPAGTTATYTADLLGGFSCPASTLTSVSAIWVYVSPNASVDLDYVRTD